MSGHNAWEASSNPPPQTSIYVVPGDEDGKEIMVKVPYMPMTPNELLISKVTLQLSEKDNLFQVNATCRSSGVAVCICIFEYLFKNTIE